jgi:cell division septal protein FtsQ
MKAPRPGRFARVAIVLGALLALVFTGGWQLLHSGLFVVRDVRVVGVEGAQSEAARQAAVLAGERLFSLDEAAAVARLQALPWVKQASVATSFPNRATIAVTPRTPIGIWRIGAVNYLVDGDGVVIGTADDSGPLPVVDGTDGTPIQVGDRVDPDPLVVASRVNDFASATLQQTVSHISYARDTGITVVAGRGVQVVLGDSHGLDFKLAEWRAVVQQTKPSDLHVLDLRGDRPYYR